MRVLVTGILGFIGSNLAENLVANGYDVTVGDVTLDAPLDIGLGNGSTWTVSGNWLETTSACSGTWSYDGSTVTFTGTTKTITKIATNQYFHNLNIADGASIAALTTCINAVGDLHVYGDYSGTGSVTIGVYFGGKAYFHDGCSLCI